MPESQEQRDSAVVSSAGEPGPLSRLLQEIFEAPSQDLLEGWKRELQPGDRLGRFEIRREVGRGGFGAVYEAFDTELNRVVAVKTLRLSRPRRDLSSDWIKNEAEAVARLDHPCIVTLFDVGTCDSGPYLVMELLRGKTLAQRIADGPVPLAEALRIAEEMAKGLAHAHQRGVLHRDLKPANVFVCEDGRVKLLDFGLAHLLGTEGVSGAGTPAYMAPEQARGEEVDQRADVYAAGRVLGDMLGEQRPRRLERAIGLATTADPAARPRDGQAWLDLIQAERHAAERPARNRRIAILASAFLLLGIGAAGIATWRVWRRQFPSDLIRVAVADFANDTRDPDLDALSGLLITSLEQSRRLTVLTRSRMWDHLRSMGKGSVDRIDEGLAREIGKAADIRALLLASVQKLGDEYVVELRAIDPERDEYLFTLRERTASKSGILPLLDRLSEKTRTSLRETIADVRASEVALRDAVTQNLEAYRSYFKGKELAARFDQRGARLAFQHALDVEPRFPLAAAEIAMLGYSYGSGDAGVLRDASSLMSQAPAKERTLVECLEAMLSGAPKLAGERARLLHSQFPDDPEVAQVVGLVFYATGDFDAALPAYEHLLGLRPDFHLARIDFNAIMQALGRGREALVLARQAAQQPGAGPASGVPLANAQMLVGDVEGAVVALRASGVDDAWVRSLLVPALAATGHSEEALAVVSRGDEHLAHQHRASAFAYGGRFRDGAAELDALGRDSTSDQALFSPVVAGYYATAGAITRARALLSNDFSPWYFFEPVARFEAGDEPGLRRLSLLLGDTTWLGRFTKALAAHRSGDTTLALATMRELDRPGGWFVPYYRGRFAAESGQDAEAAEALGRYLGPVFGGADSLLQAWMDARARILLSRSLYQLGRDNQARETLDQQFRLWRGADPELPLLAEAKALRTRLSER